MMLDASHWQLRGPVSSLRVETAEWSPERQAWKESRFSTFAVFDDAGRVRQLDQPGHEQSIARNVVSFGDGERPLRSESSTVGDAIESLTTWRYDDDGRATSMTVSRADGVELHRQEWTYDHDGRKIGTTVFDHSTVGTYFVEGSEYGYPAHGAVRQVTRYDEAGRSTDVEFFDAQDVVVQHVVMRRDARGLLVSEEARVAGAIGLPREPGMSDDDFQQAQTLLAFAWDSTRTMHEYDADGRRISERRQMGRLGETHTTSQYDERGSLCERSERRIERGMNVDDNGTPHLTPDTIRVHQTRFAYAYDAHGNWTARIASSRFTGDGAFTPSVVERRTIAYR